MLPFLRLSPQINHISDYQEKTVKDKTPFNTHLLKIVLIQDLFPSTTPPAPRPTHPHPSSQWRTKEIQSRIPQVQETPSEDFALLPSSLLPTSKAQSYTHSCKHTETHSSSTLPVVSHIRAHLWDIGALRRQKVSKV